MKSFILFILSMVIIGATLLIDYLSRHFYLYWQLPWIHPIAHFLGGLGATLLFGWFCFFSGFFPGFQLKKKITLIYFLIFVLIVGILWEIYQYRFGLISYSNFYISDTVFDLIMDLIGGLFAYYLAGIII